MRYYSVVLLICLLSCSRPKENTLPLFSQKATDTVKNIFKRAELAQKVNLDSALTLFRQAIAVSKKIKDDKGLLDAYRMAIFISGVFLNDETTALEISDEALAFAKTFGDANTLCDMYGMRALVYQASGNLDSAVAVNEIALKYMEADTAPDSIKNWPLYNNVAALYRDLGNYTLAIEYTNRYKKHLESTNDTARFITVYNNLSIYYNEANDSLNSEKNLYKARELMLLSKKEDANVYSNLTMLYNRKGKFDSAYYYSKKRLSLALARHDTLSVIRAYIGLLDVTKLSKNIIEAQHLLPEANLFFTRYRGELPPQDEKELYDAFYKNYLMTGNTMPAYMYLELAKNMGDEIRKKERNKDLEKYELDRKKVMQENVVLAKELQINKKNNTILILIIGSVLSVGVALFFLITYKRKNHLQKKQIGFMEKEKAWEHERSMLEGQLDERNRISRELHDDLGASLTTIALAGGLLKKRSGNMDRELAIISSASEEMVTTLNEIVWSLNTHNDSLQGSLAYIRKFAFNFLSKADIQLEVVENIPVDDITVSSKIRRALYLTAKEALHNIVKHSQANKVLLKMEFKDGWLQLVLHDDGVGLINKKRVSSGGGNGLNNMKKNMALINGTFNQQEKNGVWIEISCQL